MISDCWLKPTVIQKLYKNLQIVKNSVSGETPLKELFTKQDYQVVKELYGMQLKINYI
jgi:hypothetical protein